MPCLILSRHQSSLYFGSFKSSNAVMLGAARIGWVWLLMAHLRAVVTVARDEPNDGFLGYSHEPLADGEALQLAGLQKAGDGCNTGIQQLGGLPACQQSRDRGTRLGVREIRIQCIVETVAVQTWEKWLQDGGSVVEGTACI